MTKSKSKYLLIHPLLIASYPLLFFYAHNQIELSLPIIFEPLKITLLITLFIWAIALVIYKKFSQASLFTSLILFAFFTYGHINSLLQNVFIPIKPGVVIGPDKILFPLTIILFLGIALSLHRLPDRVLNQFFFTVTFALVSLQVVTIIAQEKNLSRNNSIKQTLLGDQTETINPNRDIYYIILDAYARQDTLEYLYNYDNQAFLTALQDLGFSIATRSTSNYAHTDFSLSSSLNYTYINDYVIDPGNGDLDVSFAHTLIRNNKVAQFLKNSGYTVINFASGWGPTDDMTIADINYKNGSTFSILGKPISLNEFSLVFLQTTALSPFIKDSLADQARANVLYALDKLTEIPYQRGNKFVIAHFAIPHPPYLFYENGDPIPDQTLELAGDSYSDKQNYLQQLKFITTHITPVFQEIISRSRTQPIIILQSDHGPAATLGHPHRWARPPPITGVQERMFNLFASYTPDAPGLYPDDITPINAFPILFNHYFAADTDIQENHNYFTDSNRPFQFMEFTQELKQDY